MLDPLRWIRMTATVRRQSTWLYVLLLTFGRRGYTNTEFLIGRTRHDRRHSKQPIIFLFNLHSIFRIGAVVSNDYVQAGSLEWKTRYNVGYNNRLYCISFIFKCTYKRIIASGLQYIVYNFLFIFKFIFVL